MSSCPYEARGEACQCYGINGHLSSTQVAEKEQLGEVRVIRKGPFKGRRYIKTASGWQRIREARP